MLKKPQDIPIPACTNESCKKPFANWELVTVTFEGEKIVSAICERCAVKECIRKSAESYSLKLHRRKS